MADIRCRLIPLRKRLLEARLVFIAKLATENYEFYTLGNSKNRALDNMKKAWAKHSEKYHLNFNTTWSFYEDSVNMLEMAEDSYNWEGENYKL